MTAASSEEAAPPAPPTRRALFAAFLKVGALGFGGVASLARYILVVERKMIGEKAFAEAFGVASALPGANTVNLAAMLGDRFRGPTGAAAAVLGLLGAPLMILVAAALLYARYHDNADVTYALAGAAAAAAGLVGGTALRLLYALETDLLIIAIAAVVCLASAAFQVPMLLILATAIPASVAIRMLRQRRSNG